MDLNEIGDDRDFFCPVGSFQRARRNFTVRLISALGAAIATARQNVYGLSTREFGATRHSEDEEHRGED